MLLQLHDAMTIDGGLRRTTDGYLAGTARVAKANNIQTYLGREVGRPDLATVRVFRPEAEVFSDNAMHSAAYRPFTVDHPADGVSSKNWRKHARGGSGGEIARDGDFLAVPLVLMDSAAIDEYEGGKRELSAGYECELDWTPGKTADGQTYDAVQTKIRFNHFALVGKARGGPDLKLGDGRKTESEIMTERTFHVDGVPFTGSEQTATLVAKILADRDTARSAITAKDAEIATATAAVTKANETIKAKDAEIAALNTKLADATKPEVLAAAAAARATLLDSAKKLMPTLKDAEKLGDAEIQKAVVIHKMGDAAAAFDEKGFAVAFATLAKDHKVADAQDFRTVLGRGAPMQDAALADREAAFAERQKRNATAWQNKPEAAH